MSNLTDYTVHVALLAVSVDHGSHRTPVLVVELDDYVFTPDMLIDILQVATDIEGTFQTEATTRGRIYLSFSGKEPFVPCDVALTAAARAAQAIANNLGWTTTYAIRWRNVTTEHEDALGYDVMERVGDIFVSI